MLGFVEKAQIKRLMVSGKVFRFGVLSALVLSGCSGFSYRVQESGSPSPQPVERVSESVSIEDIPVGWERYTKHWKYSVRRPGYVFGELEGLAVFFLDDYLVSDKEEFSVDGRVDVRKRRDDDVETLREDSRRDLTDVRSIGERTIGGELAAGLSYSLAVNGERYRCEEWEVWRWDGKWGFMLCSAPGMPSVPRDLSEALDRVVWTSDE